MRKPRSRIVSRWTAGTRVHLTEKHLSILMEKTRRLLEETDVGNLDIPRKIQDRILEYGSRTQISDRELAALDEMCRRYGVRIDETVPPRRG